MYNQVRLAQQQNVTAPPITTQPPVTPAQTVVAPPAAVVAPMPMAPAPTVATPWGWILGGALAIGATALLLSTLAPAHRR